MFNKFEMIGIGVSVLAMSLALFLLRINTSFLMPDIKISSSQPSAAIIAVPTATTGTDSQTALRDSIITATDAKGTINKLIIDDVTVGTGVEVKTGDTISVHYIGTLQNSTEFDNSYKRGAPFTFTVGEGKVIKGWDQGVVGMKVGGKRILVIPSDLGYGQKGYGPIPGGANLVFAVELVSIN